MNTITRGLRLAALLGVVAATCVAGTAVATAGEPGLPEAPVIASDVLDAVHEEGRASVIVQLAETVRPEGTLQGTMAVGAQRRAIADAQRGLLRELAGTRHRVRRKFKTVPFLALEVGSDALEALARSGRVRSVEENRRMTASLAQSVPLVGASEAFAEGFDGSGWAVAVIDTGIDKYHPFLAGKVVAEACFSQSGDCPNGGRTQIGSGAAAPCATAGCRHGTHVAGIAAGAGSLGTPIDDDLLPLFGRGVCGVAAAKCATTIVPNVHEFPGHIACDMESKSEIVIPLMKNERFIGVLDLDSPRLARFDEADAAGLETLLKILLASTGTDVG